jgi:hypothetical protein
VRRGIGILLVLLAFGISAYGQNQSTKAERSYKPVHVQKQGRSAGGASAGKNVAVGTAKRDGENFKSTSRAIKKGLLAIRVHGSNQQFDTILSRYFMMSYDELGQNGGLPFDGLVPLIATQSQL